MNYKKVYLILTIFAFISFFAGSTFAYYEWKNSDEDNTEIIFTNEDDFRCSVDGGGNITNSDISLVPTFCDNDNYVIKREVKVMPTIYGDTPILMNLWLDIKNLGTGLSESQNFKYTLTTSSESCNEGVVRTGNFNTKTEGDTVPLFNYMGYTSTTVDTYYLYIWLDEAETSTSTMNQTFNLSLNGICTNAPEPETYVVFNETDSTLSLYKRDE